MSKPHANRMVNELRSMNPTILFLFVGDFLARIDETNQEDIIYSKSDFARYYCIDLETFHKWIRAFCPEVWNDRYRQKRKFTNDEANYIFEKLGRVNFKSMPPQSRKELMDEIYKDKSWKKSRRYEEIYLDFEERFPDEVIKINKLPPKLVFQILKEELDGFDDAITNPQDEFFRKRIHVIQSVVSKYQQLSDHRAEVYRRLFRRWLMAKDDSFEE